jgi:hypothetical protein
VVEIPDFDRITKLPAVPRSTGSETGYAVANPTIAITRMSAGIHTRVTLDVQIPLILLSTIRCIPSAIVIFSYLKSDLKLTHFILDGGDKYMPGISNFSFKI